jgi:putative phosphoribosyl transferase
MRFSVMRFSTVLFEDREDAGRKLALALQPIQIPQPAIVLGIPRGGVVVAFQVACAFGLPLEILLSAKLRVPHIPELAFGAIVAGGGRFVDERTIRAMQLLPEEVDRIVEGAVAGLRIRAEAYGVADRPLPVAGKTAILVDDGIATGASIYASLQSLRLLNPARLLVAAPVAPKETCDWLRTVADEVICVAEPEHFEAVGQFYRNFEQVTDETVLEIVGRCGELPCSDR